MSHGLVVHDLWKGYTVGVRGCSVRVSVLRGVSFQVARGERVGILGAPGAGKTTLLHCLAGLRQPDLGAVWLAGPAIDALELLDEGLLERPLPRPVAAVATVMFSRELLRLRARADRVLVLRDGRVLPHDGPGEQRRAPTMADVASRVECADLAAVRRVAEPERVAPTVIELR